MFVRLVFVGAWCTWEAPLFVTELTFVVLPLITMHHRKKLCNDVGDGSTGGVEFIAINLAS